MTTEVRVKATEAHAVRVSTLNSDGSVRSSRVVERGETAFFYASSSVDVLVHEMTLEEEVAWRGIETRTRRDAGAEVCLRGGSPTEGGSGCSCR